MSQQVKVYRELQLLNKGVITTNKEMVIVNDPLAYKTTQTAVTGAATLTITAAQLITQVLDATPTEASEYTLPTAALLVAAIPNCKVGTSFMFFINNKASGAYTITVAAGSGGAADGTLTVDQNVIRAFLVIITSISSEAYFVYGLGT